LRKIGEILNKDGLPAESLVFNLVLLKRIIKTYARIEYREEATAILVDTLTRLFTGF
jgi:hypothetical protein